MGCRDFQVTRQLLPEEFEAPELTRREYVRMLQTARSLEDERGYVLTKLFATTGIAVLDIPSVTVEAVRSGQLPIRSGKKTEIKMCIRDRDSDFLYPFLLSAFCGQFLALCYEMLGDFRPVAV